MGKDFILQCLRRDPTKRPNALRLLQHLFVRDVIESPLPSTNHNIRSASAKLKQQQNKVTFFIECQIH